MDNHCCTGTVTVVFEGLTAITQYIVCKEYSALLRFCRVVSSSIFSPHFFSVLYFWMCQRAKYGTVHRNEFEKAQGHRIGPDLSLLSRRKIKTLRMPWANKIQLNILRRSWIENKYYMALKIVLLIYSNARTVARWFVILIRQEKRIRRCATTRKSCKNSNH